MYAVIYVVSRQLASSVLVFYLPRIEGAVVDRVYGSVAFFICSVNTAEQSNVAD